MQEELLAFEREFTQAVAGNDVAAIGRFVADGWVIVDADGSVIDRWRFLNVIESGDLTLSLRLRTQRESRSLSSNPFFGRIAFTHATGNAVMAFTSVTSSVSTSSASTS